MRGEALVVLSFVLVVLSAYFQGSSRNLSIILLLAAFVALFSGISIINFSKPSKRSESAPVLGVLLPLLLFLNYGNPLYFIAGLLMVVAFFWNSEKSVLPLVLAGSVMGWLAIGESSYVARFVGAFLLAVSIIVGSASFYFWLRYR